MHKNDMKNAQSKIENSIKKRMSNLSLGHNIFSIQIVADMYKQVTVWMLVLLN